VIIEIINLRLTFVIRSKGLELYNQNKFEEALEYYERELSIYERVQGKNSLDCADTLHNIGSVHDDQGNFK
jgi:tetratricopeptide (TPR) repeat protein